MNRKLNISKTGIKHIEMSVNAVLGADKKRVLDRKSKVYIMYDGNEVEAWLIDFDQSGRDKNET